MRRGERSRCGRDACGPHPSGSRLRIAYLFGRKASHCAANRRSGRRERHARRGAGRRSHARRGPVSRRAGARRVDTRDHRGAAARTAASRSAASRPMLGVSEATVRARYARLCDDRHPPGDRGHEPARARVRGAGDGRRPDGRAARASSRTRSRRGRRRTTSSSPRASSTSSSSSSAPTAAALLDVTNRIRALPDVITTESFLYLELWKQLYDWGAACTSDRLRRSDDEAAG